MSQFDDAVSVILSGAFYCSQAAGRRMLAQGGGVIINVASTSGYQHTDGEVASSAAMAGLIMLTQALGIEWAERGVRVAGIAPGALKTETAQRDINESKASLERYIRRTPMRRLGSVEEIAEAVFWLASEEASYVVAETLRIDGGWTAYQLF